MSVCSISSVLIDCSITLHNALGPTLYYEIRYHHVMHRSRVCQSSSAHSVLHIRDPRPQRLTSQALGMWSSPISPMVLVVGDGLAAGRSQGGDVASLVNICNSIFCIMELCRHIMECVAMPRVTPDHFVGLNSGPILAKDHQIDYTCAGVIIVCLLQCHFPFDNILCILRYLQSSHKVV